MGFQRGWKSVIEEGSILREGKGRDGRGKEKQDFGFE